MPVSCPDGSKPRFRIKKQKKGKAVRLAYCGNKVVEAVPMKKNKKGILKKMSRSKRKMGK
jgi:hypothetical protein